MSDIAAPMPGQASPRPNLDTNFAPTTAIIFILLLAVGLAFTVHGVYTDVKKRAFRSQPMSPFLMLGVALLIALGFEFVNGFHDTANAVATVIYTNSLPAQFAVVWSGFFNFLGVLLSTGAVAFGIISLLPVELIMQVGLRCRLRDGLCAALRRHHLEFGHLVAWLARLIVAHADWVDHRRRRYKCAFARQRRHLRRRLVERRPRSAIRCCFLRSSASSLRPFFCLL